MRELHHLLCYAQILFGIDVKFFVKTRKIASVSCIGQGLPSDTRIIITLLFL